MSQLRNTNEKFRRSVKKRIVGFKKQHQNSIPDNFVENVDLSESENVDLSQAENLELSETENIDLSEAENHVEVDEMVAGPSTANTEKISPKIGEYWKIR